MKSLEIVNHDLEICEKGDTDFGFMYKRELEQIKQDLEVLEIIRKYLYYIDHTIKLKPISKSVYNFDYEKLKQWLEENNHDN